VVVLNDFYRKVARVAGNLIIVWLLFLPISIAQPQKVKELTPDGPYIIHKTHILSRFIRVDEKGKILDTLVPKNYYSRFIVSSDNSKYQFRVQLHNFDREKSKQRSPDKLFVISDPHADLESFLAILKTGKIIDNNLNWIYSKNQLLILGDVFDRGDDVTTIFWLIYKLEKEASLAGGKVHFLIGNHESMVLQNNMKYVTQKYISLANRLSVKYSELWSSNTELGKWLRSKNTIKIIGKTLFVHGGISEELMKSGLQINEINRDVSINLGLSGDELKKKGEKAEIIFGNLGPLWYRGMVLNDEKYFPISQVKIENILKRFKVNRIVVGHTTLDYVTSHHSGKVISIDASSINDPEKHLGGAILIEHDKIFVVNANGKISEITTL